ncbi:MAG: CysZ protein, partial [Halieaceae bacterium]
NILIFGIMIYLGLQQLIAWMDQLMASLPEWLAFLNWILWPLISVGTLLLSGYFFTAMAIIIASPFNALLAEKAEELISGQEVAGLEGIMQALKGFPKSLARELLKLLYYLPLLLLVFVLTFIPPFSFVAPLLWFAFGAWMMSVQYCDYPMDNHAIPFNEVKRVLRERRLSSLGFGGLVSLMSGIPILNFFVVPAAVCGATIYWHKELRDTTSANSRR